MFWLLVVVFVALIAGTIDVAGRFWARDSWAVAAGMTATVVPLAWWLGGCLRGWWRARRGDGASLASTGGRAWTAVVVVLAVANVAAGFALGALALDVGLAGRERAAAALDVLTVASNVWVLMYYRVARRWDGRRAPHRPAASGAA